MKKRLLSLLAAAVLLTAWPVSAAEPVYVPYESYTYSTQSGTQAQHCPTPYRPAATIDRTSLGVPLTSPECLVTDSSGRLYIADSTANALYVLSADYTLITAIDVLEDDEGGMEFLGGPTGLFIRESTGSLYVCDTNQNRIIELDLSTYRIRRIIRDVVPTGLSADEDYLFLPTQVAVDDSGSLYVLVRNDYKGILQLDETGRFIGYIGSNSVSFDPVTRLWKKLMNKEQRRQMEQFLPVEYTNLFMDAEGLIYTVSRSGEDSPIKRLNLAGKDVLTRNGYVDVCGDITADKSERSSFTDITADEQGVIYALDAAKGRIFVYNAEGFLFYVFGGLGTQIGCFAVPSAIAVSGGNILVADKGVGRITVFSRTDYAELIAQADQSYNAGQYDESLAAWEAVLEKNASFELAYAQIGKIWLRRGEYQKAMTYFTLGNYRGDAVTKNTGFNKAFSEFRRETAARWFAPAAVVCLAALAAAVVIRQLRRRRGKGKGGDGA